MQSLLYVVIVILAIIVIAEFLYIFSLRNNIKQIADAFGEKISMDTNTLISVSTSDRVVRDFAVQMNKELKALRKERLKLEHGDKELQSAVTNIAHDLRTPLTAISGYLELLAEEPMDDKISKYLDIIRERTETLKRLTEELFRYSVINSTSEELHFERVSLRDELEIALAGAYGMLTEKNITPKLSLSEQEMPRMLDHAACQRVFSNILSNAVKYAAGDLRISLDDNGEIIFENPTQGLSEVETAQLFDRFYTVQNAKGATGLGLSIAKLLTEKMGGTIRAEWKDGLLRIILDLGT